MNLYFIPILVSISHGYMGISIPIGCGLSYHCFYHYHILRLDLIYHYIIKNYFECLISLSNFRIYIIFGPLWFLFLRNEFPDLCPK
jgi:hypothetical protein